MLELIKVWLNLGSIRICIESSLTLTGLGFTPLNQARLVTLMENKRSLFISLDVHNSILKYISHIFPVNRSCNTSRFNIFFNNFQVKLHKNWI